jgi:hypothetical protein
LTGLIIMSLGETTMSKEISREKAIELLWEQGILDWKLSSPQKIIKTGIQEDSTKISVVMCARRLGKTYLMLIMAVEKCLQTPGAIVKFVFPRQKSAKRNIVPELKKILDDCPERLKGEFKVADLEWVFPNGSKIQLAGCDGGNIENIRGGNSHLNIIDEAGFADDLKYAVRSVLGPTTKLTKGRTILVSTPSRSENHEFITEFVLPYMAENRIRVFSIFDNPQFTDAIIKDALDDYPEGEKDPEFRREYMCEIIRNSEKAILPSLNMAAEKEIVHNNYKMPVYCHRYVALDPGGTDLTAVVFGYYDYLEAKLVIQDEIVVDGMTNTEVLAKMIQDKERELWTNPIDKSVDQPYLRVADNNNQILLRDLQVLHGITFIKTKKDNKRAAINALDVDILRRAIIIDPKCQHVLYHSKFAEWNKAETDFKQLRDSPSGKIKGGHCDALAALMYLHRSVQKKANPFPAGYGKTHDPNKFDSLHPQPLPKNDISQIFAKILNKKRK